MKIKELKEILDREDPDAELVIAFGSSGYKFEILKAEDGSIGLRSTEIIKTKHNSIWNPMWILKFTKK